MRAEIIYDILFTRAQLRFLVTRDRGWIFSAVYTLWLKSIRKYSLLRELAISETRQMFHMKRPEYWGKRNVCSLDKFLVFLVGNLGYHSHVGHLFMKAAWTLFTLGVWNGNLNKTQVREYSDLNLRANREKGTNRQIRSLGRSASPKIPWYRPSSNVAFSSKRTVHVCSRNPPLKYCMDTRQQIEQLWIKTMMVIQEGYQKLR